MNEVFIVSPSDVSKLQSLILGKSHDKAILCATISELDILTKASDVYFVVSKTSMCSTAFQEVVLTTFPATENAHRWLLPLEETGIPPGFSVLKQLQERYPI